VGLLDPYSGQDVFGLQGAVEPAVAGALEARCSGLHVVLGVEVGTGVVGRAGGVDDSQMLLLIERLQRRHGGVEAEEAVQIDDLFLRNSDGGTHGVVIRLAPGNNDVEPVGCAALEDDDQFLSLCRGGGGGGSEDGPGEECRKSRSAGESEGSVAEEESS